jgi:hypothetical protein
MKKTFYVIFILILVLAMATYLYIGKRAGEKYDSPARSSQEEYISYKNSEYSPEFIYPEYWGPVSIMTGNRVCPEDDTYRTADTLIIYDFEFSFPEVKLPGSESMMRAGIRTYELNPENLNACGDEFHLKIAQGSVMPETLSSFRLSSAKIPSGLEGTFNPEASRLNTESRMQYTFYVPQNSGIFILQPYMNFIPYFESPELHELDERFGGDMGRYISEGKTSHVIRKYFEEFNKMAQSLKFEGE